MIYLLLFALICVFLVNYKISERNLLSPAVLFSASFAFSAFWAALYARKWELALHENTFFVILFGVIIFSLISNAVHYTWQRSQNTLGLWQYRYFLDRPIADWVLWVILAAGCVTVILSIKELTDWAGLPLTSVIEASRKYDSLKFGNTNDQFQFSSFTGKGRLLTKVSAYFFGLSAAIDLVTIRKTNIKKLLIILIGIISSLVLGSRADAIAIFMSCIVFLIIVAQQKRNKNSVLSQKHALIIVLFVLFLLISFRSVGAIMQRNISSGTMDYLSIYLGAEIKNLDLFLQEPRRGSAIWGSQTFYATINSIATRIGLSTYNLDLPFRNVNGYSLGNVCTVFYPFIYDFGYVGMVVLDAVMACSSQLFYEYARYGREPGISFVFSILYSKIATSLLFAFFSNKFFENNFTVGWFKELIVTLILYLAFYKIIYKEQAEFKVVKG